MARSRIKSTASKNGHRASERAEDNTPRNSSSITAQLRSQDQSPQRSDIRTMIQMRAYQLFEQRGRRHGYDVTDWLEAEQLTFAEQAVER